MPVFRIPEEHVFPHPSLAEPDGLLGVGGDLHPSRVLLAYANGIFPWYNQSQPILWFSPDPRFVLFPSRLKVDRSLKKRVRNGGFEIRLDTAFDEVVGACQARPRPGQSGTWITRDLRDAFNQLFALGFAHSVEAWRGDNLVGGLYGVALGTLFSGESMFALEKDASKVAFVWLSQQLHTWGYQLVDCQVHTHHLERFGGVHVPRGRYLELLADMVRAESRWGPWSFDPGFQPTL